MKFLLSLAMVIAVVGCSSHKEDCTYNGQKVNCGDISGNRGQEPAPAPESLTVSARGRYEIVNDQFIALTDIKNDQTKVVGDRRYNCSVNMGKKASYGVRVNEREFVFIHQGQEKTFERIDQRIDYSNLVLGKFESHDTQSKMRLTMHFISRDILEITNVCYFN